MEPIRTAARPTSMKIGYYVSIRDSARKGLHSGPYNSRGEAEVAAESCRLYFGPCGPGKGMLSAFAEYGVARMTAEVLPVIEGGRRKS